MPSAASLANSRARAAERIVLLLASANYDLDNLKSIENVTFLKSSTAPLVGACVYPALALLAKNVGKLYVATVRAEKDVKEILHEAAQLGITLLVLAPRHANSSESGDDTHDVVTWVDGGANSQTAQLVLTAVSLKFLRVHIHACNAARSFATTLFKGKDLHRLTAIGCGLVLSGFAKEINVLSDQPTGADKYLIGGCYVSKSAAASNSEGEGKGEGASGGIKLRARALAPRVYALPYMYEVESIDYHTYDEEAGLYYFYVFWKGYEKSSRAEVGDVAKTCPDLLRAYCKTKRLRFDFVCMNS